MCWWIASGLAQNTGGNAFSISEVHRRLTSDFLQLQPLTAIASDVDLVDLFHYYGNQYANSLLENEQAAQLKPNENSPRQERDDYIRRKYRIKCYAQFSTPNLTQNQLNQMLYENVETSDYKTTLRLIMQGADANYSEKMFSVADHAQRYQQIKQMKLILANGGTRERNCRSIWFLFGLSRVVS